MKTGITTNKKKLRLLIVGSSFGMYGGIESYMLALAEAAAGWPEFEVKVCFKIVKGHELQEDLQKMAGPLMKSVSFLRAGSLELFSLIKWADILHIQNAPPDVVLTSRIMGKQIYLTLHNWRRRGFSLHNLLWGLSAKLAHRRWYNSRFVWETWEPKNKSANSECIPTVSRLPVFSLPPEKRKGFLFIGRWIANKGIEEILKAYASIKIDHHRWPLTILGDGPKRPEILSLIKNLGLDHVFVPGFVEDKEKNLYLAGTRWLLAPAKTKEDLGLTPIEARSVGVPSIVSRDGGLPEAAGIAALIAEPGNVEDLARCMQLAVNMNDEEYKKRGELALSSLNDFLRPIEFYRTAYQQQR